MGDTFIHGIFILPLLELHTLRPDGWETFLWQRSHFTYYCWGKQKTCKSWQKQILIEWKELLKFLQIFLPDALALIQFLSVLVTPEILVSSTSATDLTMLFAETLFWWFPLKYDSLLKAKKRTWEISMILGENWIRKPKMTSHNSAFTKR